jgi:hypothetical protein
MVRQSVALSFACSLLAQSAAAAAGRPAQSLAASPTRIMLFNQTPAGSYDVRRNGASAGTAVASPSGGVVYDTGANPGDRYEFLMDGLDPVTPARPQGVVATGSNEGCVTVRWTPPVSTDYVSDYSLLWGPSAGALTDSVRIDGVDIAKGVTWAAGHCGFPSGTYAFALRARNAFDRWSPLSAVSTTTIGNQDTQGPLPPTSVKVTEASFGCAAVTWTRSSDATVTGYRVFFGRRPRSQAAYTDSIDVGDAASASRCGLAEGNYYVAVRAYTPMGLMSAYSKEVLLSARGMDTAAPSIAQRTPAAGATGVARNATVYFVATDDKTGVDASSISVTVNGIERDFATSSTQGGLAVQCAPAGDLPANTDIEVEVTLADLAEPVNSATRTWTFRTGSSNVSDTEAPVIGATSPASGAEGVDPRPTIEVRIRDAGLGADLASLVMQINGDDVPFTIEGTPGDAHLRYRPASAFAPQSRVDVHVEACDAAARCAELDYHFTVGAAVASVEGRGAIVPDGYWAGDPSRPLEIRNLPQDWCVRIFDTSGHTVRRHVNAAEDATWTWNFENDMGARVAPALYLVRVTDGGGTVQRSGRFLVQSRK